MLSLEDVIVKVHQMTTGPDNMTYQSLFHFHFL